MTVPFRVGVMQLTMEPLPEILRHARVLDEQAFDTIWLAEAYPWWRKHQMEARSSTALSPLIGWETERLAVGWGIISPYTRHPVQVAMEARVTQEALGGGRFYLGFGASKIFMKHIGEGERGPARPRTAVKEAIEIVRAVLSGDELDYDGREFAAHVPRLADEAETPREAVPLYVAGTGPRMQELAGEVGDGLLTPSITTPAFVRYARENLARGAERAGRDPDELVTAIGVGWGISWVTWASDYSRFVPKRISSRSVFWYSYVGMFVPTVWLAILGATIASVSQSTDPARLVTSVFGGVAAVLVMLLVLHGPIATNILNVYSSALAAASAGIRASRFALGLLAALADPHPPVPISPEAWRKPDILVPSDREIPRAVNEGLPIVTAKRNSEAAKSFRALAAILTKPREPEPAGGARDALAAPAVIA